MSTTTATPAVSSISVSALRDLRNSGAPIDLIDVRSPGEFAGARVPGAVNVPLDQLSEDAVRRARVHPEGPLYVICQSGGRSAKAVARIAGWGMDVIDVTGGTGAWRAAGYETQGSGAIQFREALRPLAMLVMVVSVVAALRISPWFWLGLVVAPVLFALGRGCLMMRACSCLWAPKQCSR